MKRTIFVMLLILSPLSAFAGVGALDSENRVTTGGGIVRPTSFQAHFYNPAGLIYNDSTKIVLMLDTPDENDLSPMYFGVFGQYGNKKIAGGAGVRSLSGQTIFYGGLAVGLGKDKGSIGVGGNISDGTTTINSGLLLKVSKKVQWGVAALDLSGNMVLGTGLSFDASKISRFAFDIGVNDDFTGPTLVAGIKFGERKMAVVINAGLELDDAGNNALPTGLNFGFDFTFGRSTTVSFTYQQINQIEADISFRF